MWHVRSHPTCPRKFEYSTGKELEMQHHRAIMILALAIILVALGLIGNSIGDILTHHTHVEEPED